MHGLASLLSGIVLSCAVLFAVEARGEDSTVIPGESVGPIKLGMEYEEVEAILGPPPETADIWGIYTTASSGDFLAISYQDGKVAYVMYSSTTFKTDDDIDPSNAVVNAPAAGYIHWVCGTCEDELYTLPGGGLVFHKYLRSDGPLWTGIIYDKEHELPHFLEDEDWLRAGSAGAIAAESARTRRAGTEVPSKRADTRVDLKLDLVDPERGMLVFKGLFPGMNLLQALSVLNGAFTFTYTTEHREASSYNPQEVLYNINLALNDSVIEITQVRHNIEDNSIFRPIVNPVDPQIDARVEKHFIASKNMRAAVEAVVDELNYDLTNWIFQDDEDDLVLRLGNLLILWADPTQRVQGIILMPALSNAWFNANDMSGDDFVQAFMDAYDVPRMSGRVQINNPGDQGFWGSYLQQMGVARTSALKIWDHASPYGFQLTINEHKRIFIEKTVKQSERQFD